MKHHTQYTADLAAPAAARAELTRALADSPGCVPNPDATLVCSELVTNAVLHGNGQHVDVTYDITDITLTITVRSEGQFADSTASRTVGGWGLYIVEQLSERHHIHTDTSHTTISATLANPARQRAERPLGANRSC